MTCVGRAVSLEIAGLFVKNTDKPAIFFAVVKKILTSGLRSHTILIENRKTPQILRSRNDIAERILQKSHLLHNTNGTESPNRAKTKIISAERKFKEESKNDYWSTKRNQKQ